MSSSIRHRAINASLWNLVEKMGLQVFQLFTTMILARILVPEDFGLIGLITVFISIGNLIIDGGFGEAIIQKRNVSSCEYSTIFYVNLIFGFLLFALLFFFAPIIAGFYNDTRLVPITRWMGFCFILDSLVIIQLSVMRKEIKFKALAKVNLISIFLSSILGILMAFYGYGVWALVTQIIASYFFKSLFIWFNGVWKPTFEFNFNETKPLLSFGLYMFLTNLVFHLFENIYILIIGKMFSTKDLGYFTQAKRVEQIPVLNISRVFNTVLFPILSQMNELDDRLKYGYRKTIKLIGFITFPLMVSLFVISHPLLVLLFSEKWLPSVPYFQILCFAGMIYTLQTTSQNILKVKGKSRLLFRLELIKKVIQLLMIVISLYFWGMIGLVWSIVVYYYFSFFLNNYIVGRVINYGLNQQIVDLYAAFFASILAGIVGFLAIFWVDPDFHFFRLIVGSMSTLMFYSIFARFVDKEANYDFWQIVQSKVKRYHFPKIITGTDL